MAVRHAVMRNTYCDSVTLMKISSAVLARPGVDQAVVTMATDANKQTVRRAGLVVEGLDDLSPSDLLIAVSAQSDEAAAEAVEYAAKFVSGPAEPSRGATLRKMGPPNIDAAMAELPGANLALISVPGSYAAAEAAKALRRGLHVMLFSDNVSLDEELELKLLSQKVGRLLMGPDCGTAIINGVPLAFANVVRRGSIGIVGASGTGIQEVTAQIHKLGGGISQAIGTGGRDLSARIGGITMLQGIAALGADPATRVLVLISKPPAPEVARRVLTAASATGKRVVVAFIGGDPEPVRAAGGYPAATLEEAACMAVALERGEEEPIACGPGLDHDRILAIAESEAAHLVPVQRYLRGLFSGGTLCDEAMLLLRDDLGPIRSNTPLDARLRLADPYVSEEDTIVDLGDDEFTRGRPHPMIDPSLRLRRLEQEAADPGTAVVLLDVVLGFGSHPDPATVLAEGVVRAKARAAAEGRYLSVVASVCGTEMDPQNLKRQEAVLRDAGVVLQPSNARAARLAGYIARLARSR